jgi:iron complex outermembrane receptor protein
MNVFSTDNNAVLTFNTGPQIAHTLLAGVDYSWNAVRKRGGLAIEHIDIYDIDYAALSDYGGGTPPFNTYRSRDTQKQLGFYLQDQIRLWDRVSVVLGARHDKVTSTALYESEGAPPSFERREDKATTYRAGIIGEVVAGVSPFFSFTESFLPITGATADGSPFKPQRGRQFELGVKWQPDKDTLVTLTGFHIKETGRPIDDPSNPLEQIQAGEETIKGVELEATRNLPGHFDIIVNYGYNKVKVKDTPSFTYLPEHNASVWTTKTFALTDKADLRLGAGVRYTSKSASDGYGGLDANGDPFNWTIVTPSSTLVDALVSVAWERWTVSVNATNLLGDRFFASCLARGDCFIGAERNVMASVNYRF